MKKWWILASCCLLFSCSNFPKDPEKTLSQLNHGKLMVGYTENPPWVIKGATEPSGLEVNLVKAYAQTQNALIIWNNDSEQDLFEKLEKRELHLVIGGFKSKNAWSKHISFTRPYLQTGKDKHVVAVIKGENAFVLSLEKFLNEQKHKLNGGKTL